MDSSRGPSPVARRTNTTPPPDPLSVGLPQPNSTFFSNAQQMGVYGSHFTSVQGNFNVVPVMPLPNLQRDSASGTAGETTSRNVEEPAQTDSAFYCAQLLRLGRGFPLYEPHPQPGLPVEYRKKGVSIGDVGRITPEGIFDFLFNIYLPANHLIHVRGVPEGFEPIEHDPSNWVGDYNPFETFEIDYCPGSYVSTESVEEFGGPELAIFPGGEFSFRCSGTNGAVLALPHGARAEKYANTNILRTYAGKHAHNWYKYANGHRGRMLRNGSLCLVYGCEKSASWGMAQFRRLPTQDTDRFHLCFAPLSSGQDNLNLHQYRWRRGTPARTKQQGDATSSFNNQTLFIHALTISLGESLRASVFGSVELSELIDRPDSQTRLSSGFTPYSGNQASFSWSLGFFSRSGRSGGGNSSQDGDTTVTDMAPLPEIINPSQIINEYILEQTPSARVVITQDDDWVELMKINGSNPPVVESVSDLMQRITASFTIVNEDGVAYLKETSETDTNVSMVPRTSASGHSAPNQDSEQESDSPPVKGSGGRPKGAKDKQSSSSTAEPSTSNIYLRRLRKAHIESSNDENEGPVPPPPKKRRGRPPSPKPVARST
ncbi:hypothetical protein C8F01DRAFT_1365405 [Mycena amicta]|nr:hypothetical protein C8F01DRAFT_1365405 [Mycena amicta]